MIFANFAKMIMMKGPFALVTFAAISSVIFSFCRMWTSKPVTNVQARNHALRKFVINPLVRIHQKEKIALEIASKVVSVKTDPKGREQLKHSDLKTKDTSFPWARRLRNKARRKFNSHVWWSSVIGDCESFNWISVFEKHLKYSYLSSERFWSIVHYIFSENNSFRLFLKLIERWIKPL